MIKEIRISTVEVIPALQIRLEKAVLDHSQDKLSGQIWKKLTLQVDGKSFDVSASEGFVDHVSYFTVEWRNPGISWTGGQKVQVRLYSNVPPSVPRNVLGFIGDNRITLNWDAPSSWGSGTAGKFEIHWKPAGAPVTDWGSLRQAGSDHKPDASVSSFVFPDDRSIHLVIPEPSTT